MLPLSTDSQGVANLIINTGSQPSNNTIWVSSNPTFSQRASRNWLAQSVLSPSMKLSRFVPFVWIEQISRFTTLSVLQHFPPTTENVLKCTTTFKPDELEIIRLKDKCSIMFFLQILKCIISHTHTHTHILTQLFYSPLEFCPGLSRWASIREVKREK